MPIIELFEASKDEREIFIRQVMANGKVVPIVVHPCLTASQFPWGTTIIPRSFSLHQAQYICNLAQTGKPLVICECDERKESLQDLLSPFPESIVYRVATGEFEPEPSPPYSWYQLGKTLNQLQVEKVTLSGIYLRLYKVEGSRQTDYFPRNLRRKLLNQATKQAFTLKKSSGKTVDALDWLQKDTVPYGCVGFTALKLLEQEIDFDFSPISWPGLQVID